MTTITVVPQEAVRTRMAGRIASEALRELLALRDTYPRSYGRERVMEEADRILDEALDEAENVVAKFGPSALPTCVVCDDLGCEHCPKVD